MEGHPEAQELRVYKDSFRYKTRDVSTVSGTKPVRTLGTTPFKTWIKWQ